MSLVFVPVCCHLVHQQLSHLHMVVEGSQVQCSVTIVLLLIYDPRPGQFGQQHPHGTVQTVERHSARGVSPTT